MAHDVFICHSTGDAAVATAACAALEAAGIRCWMAPRDVEAGAYAGQLVDAIGNAKAMLLLFSEHANASEHVLREIEIASSRGTTLIPFKLDNTTPSGDVQYFAMRVHWLDKTGEPLERRFEELVPFVRHLIGREKPPNGEEAAIRIAPPAGTVTFVFTDIDGRAPGSEDRPHEALTRATFARRSGFVFRHSSDTLCAAFARPEDAVAAIVDLQRAIGPGDPSGLQLRAALHTGTAEERDGGYVGVAVNRASRLLGIGHGGQILLSGATADLALGSLPARATLRDLGEHRLKDLARPEYVYQLLAPDLPADFPPLRSLGTLPNNLPLQLTSFVGREKELEDITELLRTQRVVTLVGTGGLGKTRTSLQVAANLLDGSGDGVWFVELAPLSSGDFIATTVATAMNLTLGTGGDPSDLLVRALATKHALIVFDNCEHLVDAAARLIAAIVRNCPRVNVLASSRQGLGIAGEETYRLPTLAIPTDRLQSALTASEALRSPAVTLFVERARAADKRFELTDVNAGAVALICRRLDGIPLAIELAAPRVKMLSPKQLLDRLDERFRVLTGGSRELLPRQQTLRAMIDWSYDLLDERERKLLRRLGVFVGGFTIEAATAIASGDDLDEFDVFDLLASLVDKSLVLAEYTGDAIRYRLLESTRAYAREKSALDGETETLASRHLYYLRDRFVTERRTFEETERIAGLTDLFAVEIDDVRAALDFAFDGGERAVGAELLAQITSEWQDFGFDFEGWRRLEQFISVPDEVSARDASKLCTGLSMLLGNSGRAPRSFEMAEKALAFARSSGDDMALVGALAVLVNALAALGLVDEAEPFLAEALALENASPRQRVNLIQQRAKLSAKRGDYDEAAKAYEQLRTRFRNGPRPEAQWTVTMLLAEIEHMRGDTPRAIALVSEALPHVLARASLNRKAIACSNLAAYHASLGEDGTAIDYARDAIRFGLQIDQNLPLIAMAAEHFALACARLGDVARAARLSGYGAARITESGLQRDNTELVTRSALDDILAKELSADRREQLEAEGAALRSASAASMVFESLADAGTATISQSA